MKRKTADNVTEWCKKEECWKKLKGKDILLPHILRKELISSSPSAGQSFNRLTEEEYEDLIKEITIVKPEIWFNIAKWGKLTNFLNSWERNFSYSTGKIIAQGKIPSVKQAPRAKKIYEKALKMGFNEEFSFDEKSKALQITFEI